MSVYSTLIQAFVGLFLVSLLFTSRGPPLVALAQENADQGEVENVAFCSTVEDLQDAVNVRKVPHIVITSHLDMAGARPVSPDSLAVLSLTSATKTIQVRFHFIRSQFYSTWTVLIQSILVEELLQLVAGYTEQHHCCAHHINST